MSRLNSKGFLAVAVLALLMGGLAANAATVLKMDLETLCDNADRIFRGTVVSVQEGTVTAGGADLPTVTYTLKVDESFKGTYTTEKGVNYATVTMLGTLKPASAAGGSVERYSFLPTLPALSQGQDYLLMTSAPSAIGLSTTVGLGQGCFHLADKVG